MKSESTLPIEHSPDLISSERQLNSSVLIIGVPLFIGGLIAIFTGIGNDHWLPILVGVLILLLTFFILFPIHVLQFDSGSNTLKMYYDYYFAKPGKEVDLNQFHSVTIKYESSAAVGTIRGVNPRYQGSTYRHYTILLLGRHGQKLFIKELNEFGKANKLLHHIASVTGLKAIPLLTVSRRGRR